MPYWLAIEVQKICRKLPIFSERLFKELLTKIFTLLCFINVNQDFSNEIQNFFVDAYTRFVNFQLQLKAQHGKVRAFFALLPFSQQRKDYN